MSRTPLNNRALPGDKDPDRKTPLANRVLPGKDKTPTGGHKILPAADIDQHLLAVMRGLNLAVAVVAEAREQRYAKPQAKLSSRVVLEAMLHLKDVAQRLEQLRRQLETP